MSIRTQTSLLGVTAATTASRPKQRVTVRRRREYDQRRRQGFVDPQDASAYLDYSKLVRLDPCSLQIVPECHEQIAADHITPLDRGGENRWTNVTSACRACNAAKKRQTLLHALLGRKVTDA